MRKRHLIVSRRLKDPSYWPGAKVLRFATTAATIPLVLQFVLSI